MEGMISNMTIYYFTYQVWLACILNIINCCRLDGQTWIVSFADVSVVSVSTFSDPSGCCQTSSVLEVYFLIYFQFQLLKLAHQTQADVKCGQVYLLKFQYLQHLLGKTLNLHKPYIKAKSQQPSSQELLLLIFNPV